LWQSEGALVAREFDVASFQLHGEPHRILSLVNVAYSGKMFAAASANGSLLYGAAVGTTSLLTWFNRDGKPLGPVGEPAGYNTLRLSPDGRRVAVSRSQQNGPDQLWILESPRGAASPFGGGGSLLPCWSPDGRTLLYDGGRPHNLFRQDVSGSAKAERLTHSPNMQLPNDWSRDGRFILYQEFVPGKAFDLMVLELAPDGKPIGSRPWLASEFNEMDARFSPEINPRWIAYHSNESGRTEIYIDSFVGPRRKIQVSTAGGHFPQWRADGRELFFQSLDYKLMSVDVKQGRDSVETSAPRELFALPMEDLNLPPYEASADGQRFLVRAAQPQPLTLITNWPALMKGSVGR
jgi:eukaryotic-like serine/threonine-protein kinase